MVPPIRCKPSNTCLNRTATILSGPRHCKPYSRRRCDEASGINYCDYLSKYLGTEIPPHNKREREKRVEEIMRPNKAKGKRYLRQTHKESVQAALTLLLGPETEYSMRVRAVRRLAKQGPAILPVLLSTLSSFPAITVPAWPWWPPQYEHCARLLL